MYSDIKNKFQKKKIDEKLNQSINIDNDLESITRYLSTIESNIPNFDQNLKKWLKNDKKNDKIIEMLNEELKEKDNEIYLKEKDYNEEHRKNLKIYNKVIEIIDSIDAIYEYAKNANNEALKLNIDNVYKKINRYLNDIGIEEIKSKMEIMDPELHECVEVKDIDEFNNSRINEDKVVEDTIVDVIKKGYKLNGNVLRVAKVAIVQNKKKTLK
ncbi:nucleotide exchange factor GrpE [Peptacetobacter hiranonis]|uniref:nucleotide exchange factor GrpE n=1 Tax=Peptacetobacter hiranonis TaxID=89152 RepID=UPI0022E58C6E|nr:nucleotide exchange factor GrpE [Peptacetobacter hiranonis]